MIRIPRWASAAIVGAVLSACADAGEIPATDRGPGPEVLQRITRPVEGGSVHLVRLTQSGDSYAFDPPAIRAVAGDVVRFVMAGSQPESVVFDTASASPVQAVEFILRQSLHLGVLLTDAGQAYDVSFAGAPAGRYPFFSQPHVGRGMRGEVVIGQ